MTYPLSAIQDLAAEKKSALATGPFGSSIGSKTFQDEGVPVIRGSNLSATVGLRLVDDGLVFIDPVLAEKFARSKAVRGDLVFTCWGTVNQVGLIDKRSEHEEYIVSNKQMKFTADARKASPLFLYYYFSSPLGQQAIADNTIGSSVPGFNLTALRNIRVPNPPLPVQNSIARCLGSLDDKIELNQRMNETLEEMARALFRDWFVDFGPTRRQIEGATDPAAIMGYAFPAEKAATLAPMFPSTLGDNGLPEGWEKQPYETLCKFVGGNAFKKEEQGRTSGEIAFIKVSDMNLASNSRFIISANNYVDASDQPRMKFKLHPKGSVVLAKIGIALTYNRLRILTDQTAIDNNMLSASPLQTGADTTFLFLSLSQIDFNLYAKGSALPYLNAGDLSKIDFTSPGERLKTEIENIARPLLQMVLSNSEENQTLAALRDLLLPKLMSGEIRLKAAEEMV